MNPYTYAGLDPMHRIDPSGLSSRPDPTRIPYHAVGRCQVGWSQLNKGDLAWYEYPISGTAHPKEIDGDPYSPPPSDSGCGNDLQVSVTVFFAKVTFGNHNGQKSIGIYAGAGEGFSYDIDRSTTRCAGTGFAGGAITSAEYGVAIPGTAISIGGVTGADYSTDDQTVSYNVGATIPYNTGGFSVSSTQSEPARRFLPVVKHGVSANEVFGESYFGGLGGSYTWGGSNPGCQ